jgi:hypothetical protein
LSPQGHERLLLTTQSTGLDDYSMISEVVGSLRDCRSGMRGGSAEAVGRRRRVVGGARGAAENVNASTAPLGIRQGGRP